MDPRDRQVQPLSGQEAPLISVIVPTFNAEVCLRDVLNSLVHQSFRGFELLISDGASTDATLEISRSYENALPSMRVMSRPDGGVYDAINLALSEARGRWVLILGADDKLHSASTLEQVAAQLRRSDASFVYGDVKVIGANAMVEDGARYGGPFSLARLLGENICQQAIFYRRSVFDELGNFRLQFRLWADWDFAQKLFVAHKGQWIDVVIADYAATGMSSHASDAAFESTWFARLGALWLRRPWSLLVPLALLKFAYWRWQPRRK